jgi:rhodanese-related sulfurtransferase
MSGREILNPCASLRCEVGPAEALVEGSSGSSWTTRDKRRLQGWPDAGPPDNVIVLASSQIGDWEAKVECRPRQHGEQAGLYAYADETSWVKFVVEGVAHSEDASATAAQLILASQHDGVPTLVGKQPLPVFGRALSLRLTVRADGASAEASYRLPGSDDDAWRPMPRGLGWLRKDELAGRPYGSLEPDDPRGQQTAAAALPAGWRPALVTEQWSSDLPKAKVRFSDFNENATRRCLARTELNRGLEQVAAARPGVGPNPGFVAQLHEDDSALVHGSSRRCNSTSVKQRSVWPWWLPGCLGGGDEVDGTDPILTAPGTQIVDLRWGFEFRQHRLVGARRCPLLPQLISFERRLTELGMSPSAPTVVICEHAVRSPLGVKKLRAMGFSDVRQLRGGMSRWLRVPGVPLAAAEEEPVNSTTCDPTPAG